MKDKSKFSYYYPHAGSSNMNFSYSSYTNYRNRHNDRAILLNDQHNNPHKVIVRKYYQILLIKLAKV